MLPITTPAYVVTSPYTSVPMPLTRPISAMSTFAYYEQQQQQPRATLIPTPQLVYTNMVDSYISQQTHSNAAEHNKQQTTNDQVRLFDPLATITTPAFIQQPVVYQSVVGDLISQQSFLNAERAVDDKINKTVHEQIQRYELDRLKEQEFKRRLAEYEEHKHRHDHCGSDHKHEHQQHHHCGSEHKHEHDQHHHHHHKYERTQGSQTDLSLKGLTLKDDSLCCCTSMTGHKIPVCDKCVCDHTDCCLEEKIRRIRHELHLPAEGTLNQHHYHDHREIVTEDKPKVTFTNKKYEVDIATIDRPSRSRSRTTTATSTGDRPKSRSRSLSANSRPLWKPTGANDYTWTHIARADILNGAYRENERMLKRSKSKDQANQTASTSTSTYLLPSDVTYIYPIQQTISNQYEYHEVPVRDSTKQQHRHVQYVTRSHSKPRSGSPPAWRSTNKNDYNWTTQAMNNYDNNHYNSKTKTTVVNSDKRVGVGQLAAEVFYSYETIRPRTSVDHFYSKDHTNKSNHPATVYYHTYESKKPAPVVHLQRQVPVQTDYYYYETKPNTKYIADKSTSTSLKNAIGTQTYAEKGSSTKLEYSRDQNNKYSVYVK